MSEQWVTDAPEDVFWSKVDKSGGLEACWAWMGSISKKGYGMFYRASDKRWLGAHRVAYELTVGRIPEGLHIDHLCRVRNCVNPSHLEPVTPTENTLRGVGFAAQNARKTHCLEGHELAGDNIAIRPRGGGERECKTCRSERDRKYKSKQRIACPECDKEMARSSLKIHMSRRHSTPPTIRYAEMDNGKTEFDEFVADNAKVHFEVMGEGHYWMSIEVDGRTWHINCGTTSTRAKGYANCEEVT